MRERLKQLISATFDVPAQEIPDDAAAGTFPPWDSLGHLGLLMAVEAEFGVRIPAEQMMELTSIESIESYLKTHGSA